jgi:hypothetical protein
LKHIEPRQVVVYTLGDGVQPAWSIHLYCPSMLVHIECINIPSRDLACNTNYHHNFSVHEGVRTYYRGRPRFIQVGEHQFVEDRVAEVWTRQMILGWYSHFYLPILLHS